MNTSSAQPRDPMTHELKCWPDPFQAVQDGLKPFEWRRNDRDYQEGDTIHLREWMPDNGYTGREITVTVTYILRGPGYGIPEGYCIMGIQRLDRITVPIRLAERPEAAYASVVLPARPWEGTYPERCHAGPTLADARLGLEQDFYEVARLNAAAAPQERRPERA